MRRARRSKESCLDMFSEKAEMSPLRGAAVPFRSSMRHADLVELRQFDTRSPTTVGSAELNDANDAFAGIKGRRILAAGGCGFIGHRVVSFLREHGAEVLVVDTKTGYGIYDPVRHAQNHERRKESLGDTPVHDHTIVDGAAMRQVFEDFQPHTIIQLANVPIARVAAERPMETCREIVHGTVSLLEASRTCGAKRFVYISSSMTYGDFEQDEVTESHAQRPREVYGSLKVACEHLVRSYTIMHGLEHTIVRPIAVYGPTGNETFVITKFVRAALAGGEVTLQGADTKLDFTFVDDAARGIALASSADSARNETFNISSGHARSLMEVAAHLKSLVPQLTIAEVGRDPLYPKRGGLSIDKARALLGYEPKYNLEQGLETFLAAV